MKPAWTSRYILKKRTKKPGAMSAWRTTGNFYDYKISRDKQLAAASLCFADYTTRTPETSFQIGKEKGLARGKPGIPKRNFSTVHLGAV